MAGEWLKFEANTPEKPEVFAITVSMGWDDPDLTVGKLLKIWRWFDQQTVDGNAASVSLALLDRISGVSGFAKAMADVGWLTVSGTSVSLPNFDRHNGKTAKERALTAKRVAKHKGNAEGNGESNAKGNAGGVTVALPKEEKRREEKIKEDVENILVYLNEKAKRSYKPVPANVKFVRSRLEEGATVDECRAVIDAKVKEWALDDKMSKFLRPETLFNATKFASYVGELGTLKLAASGGSVDPRFAGAK